MTIASIDAGTNTVLLLVAEISRDSQKILPLRSEYRIPRLGRGLKPGENIHDESISKFVGVLEEYEAIYGEYACDEVLLFGTNAFRIAQNSKAIVDEIKSRFGISLTIISGAEEARLSYLGASYEYNDEGNTCVIDIGGGSTEVSFGKGNSLQNLHSYDVGVVSLSEKYIKEYPADESTILMIQEEITQKFLDLKYEENEPLNVVAIGGTPTTAFSIFEKLRTFDESLIEGKTLSLDALEIVIDEYKKMTLQEIRSAFPSFIEGREDVLLAGMIILHTILEQLSCEKIIVSTRGIRYGAIIDYQLRTFGKYS